jgi:hypothetical protein
VISVVKVLVERTSETDVLVPPLTQHKHIRLSGPQEATSSVTHEAIWQLVTWLAERCKRDKNSIKTAPVYCRDAWERYVREYIEREREVHNHNNSIFTSSRIKPFIYSEVYILQRKKDTACTTMQFSCLVTAVCDIKPLSFGAGSHSVVSVWNFAQKLKI